MAVNADFHSDFMLNYGMLLPPMLADGVRVMIYIGMQVSAQLPCCQDPAVHQPQHVMPNALLVTHDARAHPSRAALPGDGELQ